MERKSRVKSGPVSWFTIDRLNVASIPAAIAIAVSALLLMARPCSALTLGPLDGLQLSLATLAQSAPGEVGIAVEDIPSGRRLAVNGAANMPAASVIKIPVMVEAFRQMQLGTLDLTEQLKLQAHDRDWGWGDLADAGIGSQYSINRLLRLMITESDNTATNMLIRRLGLANINASMKKLTLHTTVLGEDIRSEGNIRSLRTSPNDMIILLDAMAHERLIDPWSSREMLAILAGQQHNGLLPVPLPRGLEIAHKTGTLHDTLNDVGIVFLNGDPYAIAVMTTRLPTLDLGRSFIRNVSRIAYEAFTHQPTELTPLVPLDPIDDNGGMPAEDLPHASTADPAKAAHVKAAPKPSDREDDLAISHTAITAAVPSDLDQAVTLPTAVPPQASDAGMWLPGH